MHEFGTEEDCTPFTRVGMTHSSVIPSEGYTRLVNSEDQLREIALLQQKAQSLTAEIEKRKKLEKQKR